MDKLILRPEEKLPIRYEISTIVKSALMFYVSTYGGHAQKRAEK